MVDTVSKVGRGGIDEVRKIHRMGGESDLSLLTKMHLLFQAVGKRDEEQEVMPIVFGSLAINGQDRLLEVFPMETLSFNNMIDFFKGKQEKEE